MPDDKAQLKLDRSDYRLFTAVPTRWGDSDALGHINNAMLVRYLESGRIDYFQQVCQLSLAGGEPYGFIIANLEIGFVKQVHHPSNLEVATRISRLGNSSFDVDAVIFKQGEDNPLITSRGICVWFDLQNNTSLRLPEDIRNFILNFEQGDLA